MAHIDVHEPVEIADALLIEGFPGLGLVGKITVDHLVETLDMQHFADVHCDGLPKAASFAADSPGLHTPVRLHAAPEENLVVLQSDVQVTPDAAYEFAECVSGWLDETGTTPVYVAGIAPDEEQDSGPPAGVDGESNPPGTTESTATDGTVPIQSSDAEETKIRGVASGPATALVEEADLPVPEMAGMVSGPSGALLAHALEADLPALGLVVDTHTKFPDPGAAKAVLQRVVEPLAGVDVAVETLDHQAEQVQRAKEQLAERVAADDEKSSKATALPMYQ
ncbi:MAG: proteasome assembly chaperone family protein [Halobaculum sp.]